MFLALSQNESVIYKPLTARNGVIDHGVVVIPTRRPVAIVSAVIRSRDGIMITSSIR